MAVVAGAGAGAGADAGADADAGAGAGAGAGADADADAGAGADADADADADAADVAAALAFLHAAKQGPLAFVVLLFFADLLLLAFVVVARPKAYVVLPVSPLRPKGSKRLMA